MNDEAKETHIVTWDRSGIAGNRKNREDCRSLPCKCISQFRSTSQASHCSAFIGITMHREGTMKETDHERCYWLLIIIRTCLS